MSEKTIKSNSEVFVQAQCNYLHQLLKNDKISNKDDTNRNFIPDVRVIKRVNNDVNIL